MLASKAPAGAHLCVAKCSRLHKCLRLGWKSGILPPMQYAIMRIRKRSIGSAGAMARHALREDPTPNADPAKLSDNTVVAGPAVASEVVKQLKARTDHLAKRKDAVRVVELFVGASPEIMAKMSRKQQDQYFVDSLIWISKKLGGGDKANIVSAVIHRDETTPHMQVLMTPIVDGKLQANKMIGGPAGLSKMQDEFAQLVGAKHGMRRGEKGSRAKHTTIKQFYGAIQAAGGADALPPRVPVPPAPEKPGFFTGSEKKAEYERALKERQDALDANKRREQTLIRLAALGIATHGRGRRSLPGRLSEVESMEGSHAAALALAREAQAMIDEMTEAQRAAVIAKAKARLEEERRLEAEAAKPKPEKAQAGSRLSRKPKPR